MIFKIFICFLAIFLMPSCSKFAHRSKELAILESDYFNEGEKCYKEENFNNEYFQNLSVLYKAIDSGNTHAFDIGLLVMRCLSGGELGDLYRSFGSFFEKDSKYFFDQLTEREIRDVRLQKMLTMLPLSTVDDIESKIKTIQFRIALLSNVRSQVPPELYSSASSFLENSLSFYHSKDHGLRSE